MRFIFICIFLYFWPYISLANCYQDDIIISLNGNIVVAEKNQYFLYGYHGIAPQPRLDFLWQCSDNEILGFPVIKSQNTLEDMLVKGFEIAPIDLSETEAKSLWENRLALPLKPFIAPQDIYQYRLIAGKVKALRKNSRSFWIDMELGNGVPLSLYIPKAYFESFDFKTLKLKKGEVIHAVGLVEKWQLGFVVQVVHPQQIAK